MKKLCAQNWLCLSVRSWNEVLLWCHSRVAEWIAIGLPFCSYTLNAPKEKLCFQFPNKCERKHNHPVIGSNFPGRNCKVFPVSLYQPKVFNSSLAKMQFSIQICWFSFDLIAVHFLNMNAICVVSISLSSRTARRKGNDSNTYTG